MIREEAIRCREEIVRMVTQVVERSSLADVVKKTVRDEIDKNMNVPTPVSNNAAALGKIPFPQIPKVTGVNGPVLPTPKMFIVRYENKECQELKTTLKKTDEALGNWLEGEEAD